MRQRMIRAPQWVRAVASLYGWGFAVACTVLVGLEFGWWQGLVLAIGDFAVSQFVYRLLRKRRATV